MAENASRDLLVKILSDHDLKETVEDIVEVWGKRHNLFAEFFLRKHW